MKTNAIARSILRIRAIVLCLALVGLAVVEFGLGQSLAARYGQYNAGQTQAPPAPSLSIGEFMAWVATIRIHC